MCGCVGVFGGVWVQVGCVCGGGEGGLGVWGGHGRGCLRIHVCVCDILIPECKQEMDGLSAQ